VSETAYELGMALGIAALGSILTAVYRTVAIAPNIPSAVAAEARDSLPGAIHAAQALPANQQAELLTAAKAAFTDGLALASGVGAALLLAAAVAVWLLLRPKSELADGPAPKSDVARGPAPKSDVAGGPAPRPQSPRAAEICMLANPCVHSNPRRNRGVDAACGAELGDGNR
ncbi:MAG: hypothetical protein K0U84_18770, partial [Actinomycetia bacterium]|nr:hypothetical protein [Actinomycetes bacterium]